ncbi:hypothetical protein CJF32_00001246 [Rutstroemia sp. NJR-2017a WRK4]|nr:hypothetical protein CJF32_00001246 [Rutstroemia sp. NJR-2017a WRK4]
MTLTGESEAALATIRDYYISLRMLTTEKGTGGSMEVVLTGLNDDRVVAKALELVDERFRAVASLQEIIVEMYEYDPTISVRTEIERRGWRIVEFEFSCNDDAADDGDGFDIDNRAMLKEGGGQGRALVVGNLTQVMEKLSLVD